MRYLMWIVMVFCAAIRPVWPQSLAEAARKETERRRQLAAQGITGKVIEGDGKGQGSTGNVTTFTRGAGQTVSPARAGELKNRTSASTYRNLLQKLDRQIVECADRLDLLRRQMEADKWSLPKVGRPSLRQGSQDLKERRLKQLGELEAKLKRLRSQRLTTYDAGRKAGYLPGELDGKGLAP